MNVHKIKSNRTSFRPSTWAVKRSHINGDFASVSETKVWILGTEEGSYPVYQSGGLKNVSEIITYNINLF